MVEGECKLEVQHWKVLPPNLCLVTLQAWPGRAGLSNLAYKLLRRPRNIRFFRFIPTIPSLSFVGEVHY